MYVIGRTNIHDITLWMSQFGANSWTFVAAVTFVARNASLAAPNYRLDVEARMLDVLQRQSFQYLMFLRIADVQVSVRRRNAKIIFVSYLRCAENIKFSKFIQDSFDRDSFVLFYAAA